MTRGSLWRALQESCPCRRSRVLLTQHPDKSSVVETLSSQLCSQQTSVSGETLVGIWLAIRRSAEGPRAESASKDAPRSVLGHLARSAAKSALSGALRHFGSLLVARSTPRSTFRALRARWPAKSALACPRIVCLSFS